MRYIKGVRQSKRWVWIHLHLFPLLFLPPRITDEKIVSHVIRCYTVDKEPVERSLCRLKKGSNPEENEKQLERNETSYRCLHKYEGRHSTKNKYWLMQKWDRTYRQTTVTNALPINKGISKGAFTQTKTGYPYFISKTNKKWTHGTK